MMLETGWHHCSANLIGLTDLELECSGEHRHAVRRQNQLWHDWLPCLQAKALPSAVQHFLLGSHQPAAARAQLLWTANDRLSRCEAVMHAAHVA